ncbi:MAG: flagellar motor switch phosphatase FliY [Clostridiales bacterium]|nr:flagellar motor switch phosphatase FliY [Clostridiales bacterium]
MMTQEEINSMMNKDTQSETPVVADAEMKTLNGEENDAMGEIGNICMGTCATTLNTILGKRVSITTPKVSTGRISDHIQEFKTPFIAVEVAYTEGISGYNIFILKQEDVLLITNLLMGGDGNVEEGAELDELAFSAIGEVMNQMVGSSSTALANILGRTINISTPSLKTVNLENPSLSEFINKDDITIKISFTMEIEDLLVSEIMQIIPYESGKEILKKILEEEEQPEPTPQPAKEIAQAPPVAEVPSAGTAPVYPNKEQNVIGVKAVEYQSFDGVSNRTPPQKDKDNMGLIMEVPLHVTVELGSCKKSIKEILGFTTGSVIVLDRVAGEMVDIMINGVLFAVGEVVVIDDSYGVRITEIIKQPN